MRFPDTVLQRGTLEGSSDVPSTGQNKKAFRAERHSSRGPGAHRLKDVHVVRRRHPAHCARVRIGGHAVGREVGLPRIAPRLPLMSTLCLDLVVTWLHTCAKRAMARRAEPCSRDRAHLAVCVGRAGRVDNAQVQAVDILWHQSPGCKQKQRCSDIERFCVKMQGVQVTAWNAVERQELHCAREVSV